jgi:hypothetical protein
MAAALDIRPRLLFIQGQRLNAINEHLDFDVAPENTVLSRLEQQPMEVL